MRCSGLAYLLAVLAIPFGITAVPAAAFGDGTLVLNLPPSKALQDAAAIANQLTAPKSHDSEADKSAKEFSRYNNARIPTVPNRSAAAVRGREKVIGRLGVADRSSKIYASRGSRRRALARVSAGTYLALTGHSGDWFGVLMADHTTGWISRSDVKILDYEVVGPDSPQPQFANFASGSQLLNGGQQTILNEAFKYLGVPYHYGGTSTSGMDCSAFVQRCFGMMGVQLPRTAAEQSACGAPVSPDQLQAADRLYFANRSGRISHTGIYIGNGYFIHSSSSRGGVAVSRLSEPMYQRMYAGARR